MLERIQDAPVHTLALKASGTILAQDIEAAIEAALGSTNAATGLVVVIDRDFDGYFAELARGLANASLAHRSLVKLAVVDRRRPDGRSQAQRLRRIGRPDPAVRPAGPQRRVRLGGGGAARRIATLKPLFRPVRRAENRRIGPFGLPLTRRKARCINGLRANAERTSRDSHRQAICAYQGA